MLTTSTSYRLLTRDLTATLARKAAEAPVSREIAYYLDTIGSIRSIDDFMADRRIYNFAMTAFGLEDMAYARAFMRKILQEGTADPQAFVHRLNEDRFLEFARVFDFARNGDLAASSASARQGVVDRFVRQKVEIEAGEENDGVRLALYFERKAPEVNSPYDLLADPALWKVMTTVFGFPEEMAAADVEKQAAALTQRLDIADLADPEKLDRLLARFTATWDATEAGVQDPVLTLFGASPAAAAIDIELIATLNTLKRGG